MIKSNHMEHKQKKQWGGLILKHNLKKVCLGFFTMTTLLLAACSGKPEAQNAGAGKQGHAPEQVKGSSGMIRRLN